MTFLHETLVKEIREAVVPSRASASGAADNDAPADPPLDFVVQVR